MSVTKKSILWNILEKMLIIFLVISFVIIFQISKEVKEEITNIRSEQNEQLNRHVETNQFLLSTIDWSSRRTSLILFIRDHIVSEWMRIKHKISLDEAYLIAETIVKECDNYSYIEPFFILATQSVESSYRKNVVSKAGAIGINQIMPSTGRIMAGYFGMEYSDSLLYNIQISTKFAVKLFDFLYTQYKSWDVVLADYNGGPWQAYYFRKEKDSLAKETAAFVPNVLSKKKQIDSVFSKFRINEEITKAPAAK